jgi:hypothetical protein
VEPLPSPAYTELLGIIRKYVSHSFAESPLVDALFSFGKTPETFQRADAERVIERAMVGIRFYCVSANLPYLMIALAEYCEGGPPTPRSG